MLDFLYFEEKFNKNNVEVKPSFRLCRSKDLMIKGKDFYAIWDESAGLWNTSEQRAIDIIDAELDRYVEENASRLGDNVYKKYMWSSSSGTIDNWHKFCQKQMRDNYVQLDNKVIFKSTKTKKEDYATKKLDYDMVEGSIDNYQALIGTLFDEDERKKVEWAIGAIISGDSKVIQKFLVLYGEAGTGKSTFINIIQMIFNGYYSTFEAKTLGSANNQFALEAFKDNPLVAIQHDGDLSNIVDNTKLNSIISHERMVINEKFKAQYESEFNSFLIMGTNEPVDLRGSKTGMNRRLIDVRPTGDKVSPRDYENLYNGIKFEIGSIAYHCYMQYKSMGKNYYNTYVPKQMKTETDDFFNFIEDDYELNIKHCDMAQLVEIYGRYKMYCDTMDIKYVLPYKKVRSELRTYFHEYHDRYRLADGTHLRNVYIGFRKEKLGYEIESNDKHIEINWINLDENESYFDSLCKECPAQYANDNEAPINKWDKVKTVLSEIDTSRLHYVRVPEKHIVIDFDIKDETGNKSLKLNLEAASKWPQTYAELSKGGSGIHLHYIYTGDPTELSRVYDDNIEIKVFTGNSSLRRKLTKCNDKVIAEISSGLPLKEKGKKMVNTEAVKTEKGLRILIKKNLNKEIHPGTKPSIDFIFKILDDAYNNGLHYDVTDLRQSVLAFAANSSHQSEYCLKLVNQMKFKSEEPSENIEDYDKEHDVIIFYDIEVFPNLFLVNWKKEGEGNKVVRMINPTSYQIADLVKYKLVGFNNRRYDNHVMYAAMNGYNNEGLYQISQRIINGEQGGFFGEAYNLSYADIYDYSSKKQSLKKWEIELGIHHQELGLPWDQPVDEELWDKVAEYCDNDVIATEAVWNATQQDFVARQVLADISGLSVNDTTRMHTTKIIFGNEKHPDLVYTDLREMFPGYEFKNNHSSYHDEDPGEGGYVYAEPGMYTDVALLDIASMHPSSIRALNLFGSYTKNFTDILDARICIKHHNFDGAGDLLNGAFKPYLKDENQADALAQALKIVINSVYGYTTASFDNPFKDPRNVDNIVAKRGALFMINLKEYVQSLGYTVAHIKTDSIKIPNATPEIIKAVTEYGNQYGYNFEHEATYDRMCLVNNAVYIAKYKDGKHAGEWTATGTQFQVPYVFKKLFSKEDIVFDDLCETKSVSTSLYLDMNEDLPEGEHDYRFVGKIGSFCPIKPGCGGGELLREKDGKYSAATGSKGYRWMEAEMVKAINKFDDIDRGYYDELVNKAVEEISIYGDFEWFAQ